jgi:branched-chain amino acid aminotransferase
MLDVYGYVSEGSGQNLFAVRDGVLLTPPLSAGILSGITRDSIVRIARDAGIEVREANLLRDQLYTADEAFFTGTAAELTPIRSIDGVQVGAGRMGPVTRRLQESFLGLVRGERPDPYGWLTLVPPAEKPS